MSIAVEAALTNGDRRPSYNLPLLLSLRPSRETVHGDGAGAQ